MPILGTTASGISGNLTPPFTVTPSYESIATVDMGGQTQFTFSGIPQTFKHLQIRTTARSTINNSGYIHASIVMRINGTGIRGAIYTSHRIYQGTGTSTGSGSTGDQEFANGLIPSANLPASIYGSNIFDIFDYTDNNKNTTFRILTGYDTNTNNNGLVSISGGMLMETSDVTSISVSTDYNFAFATGSTMALYGVKG